MKMYDSSSNKKKDKSHKNKHGRNGIVALRRAKRCLGYESSPLPLRRVAPVPPQTFGRGLLDSNLFPALPPAPARAMAPAAAAPSVEAAK